MFSEEQDACRGVHSACRREVNRHKLDICVLRLRQGRIQAFSYVGQNFLVLKWGGGLDWQIWHCNRAHETKRAIPQFFSLCRRRLWHKRKHHRYSSGYSTNNAINTQKHFYYKQGLLLALGDCILLVWTNRWYCNHLACSNNIIQHIF